jgi:DNA-binding NarL/FixJ family response regulator
MAPDIIFLDINMPFKNGKICFREIRNNEKINHVPTMMFSTSSHYKDIAEVYEERANFYILKSEFFEHQINMLKTIFSTKRETLLAQLPKENFILKAV